MQQQGFFFFFSPLAESQSCRQNSFIPDCQGAFRPAQRTGARQQVNCKYTERAGTAGADRSHVHMHCGEDTTSVISLCRTSLITAAQFNSWSFCSDWGGAPPRPRVGCLDAFEELFRLFFFIILKVDVIFSSMKNDENLINAT